jgi:hypothetical protein
MPTPESPLPPVSADDLLRMIGDLTVTVARLQAALAANTARRAESEGTSNGADTA